MNAARIQLKFGLLTIKASRSDSLALIDAMMEKTRTFSRIEVIEQNERVNRCLGYMARYARMCYELYQSNTLTDLSKEDVEALYDLPLARLGNFHNILNEYRYLVSPSGIDDITEGHIMAKSIRTTLES